MSNLKQQMQELIDKSMPAIEANSLKKYIEESEEIKKKYEGLVIVYNDAILRLEKSEAENVSLKNFHKEAELRLAQANLTKSQYEEKERLFEIEKLKYQLKSEIDKTNFSQSLALGLVRNIEYRNSIFDTRNESGRYVDGKWHDGYNLSTSHTEDKTAQ